ncbi:hypothetical protein GCM10027578_44220 [Spirosoma luteolum]
MNNQKDTERKPIDDLFARRLGQAAVEPSADGFARLQARLQAREEKKGLVFWQNPAMRWAAAACVGAACLVGWLTYQQLGPSGATKSDVAISRPAASDVAVAKATRPETATTAETTTSVAPAEQVQVVGAGSHQREGLAANQPSERAATQRQQDLPAGAHQTESIVVDKTATGSTTRPKRLVETPSAGNRQERTESGGQPMIAQVESKATPAINTPSVSQERVLVVTIDEPEALVAARQTAVAVVNNMPVLAAQSKEAKSSFWKQLKRLKQDDDVARFEDKNEESGLLSRAYKGIRDGLAKEKTSRQ